MKTIKAVCFDMDGLLFNTEDLFDEVGEIMLQRRGHQLDPAVVRRMMGLQADLALTILIEHYRLDDSVDDLKDETNRLFDELLPEKLQPMPGALDLLSFLSEERRLPLALTTSSHAGAVERIMSLHDLSHFFQFRLTAEDISESKPHPEIYLTAAARFGVTSEETLVFEDSENGCRSGVAASARVVAVPSKHAELHSYDGAALVSESLEDPRIRQLL